MKLCENDYHFMPMVWENELVMLYSENLDWKRSNIYTMLRKMCEKVLSRISMNIVHKCSKLFLPFVANWRSRLAIPLAFKDIDLRECIKNIPPFKEPKKWVITLVAIFCVSIITSCAANLMENTGTKSSDELYGNYMFETQIYRNPFNSFDAFDGYREYYTLTENLLILTDDTVNKHIFEVTYKQTAVYENEFNNSFMMYGFDIPNISHYKNRFQYTLYDASGSAVYRIYLLDDEIWLAQIHKDIANNKKSEYIWNIYKITRFYGKISKSEISETLEMGQKS